MIADKSTLLGARNLPYEDVPCPELGDGVVVRVRCITAAQKDKYGVDFYYQPDGALRPVFDAQGCRARLIQLACVDEQGSQLFSEDDLPMLRELRTDVADRLFDVAQRLAGMNATIEDLKRGFQQTRHAGSSTT
jgi:hypothetical protein